MDRWMDASNILVYANDEFSLKLLYHFFVVLFYYSLHCIFKCIYFNMKFNPLADFKKRKKKNAWESLIDNDTNNNINNNK